MFTEVALSEAFRLFVAVFIILRVVFDGLVDIIILSLKYFFWLPQLLRKEFCNISYNNVLCLGHCYFCGLYKGFFC